MSTREEDVCVPKDESRSELEACREELGALRQQHLRLAADFQNGRRRWQADFDRAVTRERGELLREILELVDGLERAIEASGDAREGSLRVGLESVVREARHLLAKRGVEKMDSVGASFDPERHEAVGLTEDGDDGLVHSELRPGYLLEGEVLRPAEVLVGKGGRR